MTWNRTAIAYLILSLSMLVATCAAAPGTSTGGSNNAAQPISPDWFAMHVLWQSSPWPSTVGLPFSSWRTVSSNVKWSDINTAPGVYDWTYFDRWMSEISANGQSVLYTMYYTPSWASQCPACVCNQGTQAPGGCYAPVDLNADGTGTDKHLKDFVTALMQHVGPGKIKYIEIWNEPNIPSEYAGTVPQLVSMARDVRQIAQSYDPQVEITSPPETGDGKHSAFMTYLGQFLAAGGGNYVDVMGMHGYVQNPEDIVQRVNAATSEMQQYGQSGKPLFITEGSWCCDTKPIPTAQQPGFSFRLELVQLSTAVKKFYLYAYDSPQEGNFWNTKTGQLTPTGIAYQLTYNWLVGATMTQPCQAQSGGSPIWSCTFTKPGSYQAEAVWDTALPQGGGTTSVTVGSQYVQYRDIYGKVYKIYNNRVPAGFDPIWLEN